MKLPSFNWRTPTTIDGLKLLSFAFITLSITFTLAHLSGNQHELPTYLLTTAETTTENPAGNLTYKEWRHERAKWLMKRDSFQEYALSEALDTVNRKVNGDTEDDINQYQYGTTTKPDTLNQ